MLQVDVGLLEAVVASHQPGQHARVGSEAARADQDELDPGEGLEGETPQNLDVAVAPAGQNQALHSEARGSGTAQLAWRAVANLPQVGFTPARDSRRAPPRASTARASPRAAPDPRADRRPSAWPARTTASRASRGARGWHRGRGGAPSDAGKQRGIAACQPDEPIAAVLRRAEHDIVARRQRVAGSAHIVEMHRRAVCADDDHARSAAQPVFGGSKHAGTQVAVGLQVHVHPEYPLAGLDERVFSGRCRPHLDWPDARERRRGQGMPHHAGNTAPSPLPRRAPESSAS